MAKRPYSVIFVLGGPGSGKGTQCELVCAQRNLKHLSIGDILRSEQAKPGSVWASTIEANIRNGYIGMKEMTTGLLKDAMLRHKESSQQTRGFVVDGFPRTLDRALYFEDIVEQPLAVIVLDCSEEVMKERLKLRTEWIGRVDDNELTIKTRMETFARDTDAVLDHYSHRQLLIRIDGIGSKEEVQVRVLAAVDEALARKCHC